MRKIFSLIAGLCLSVSAFATTPVRYTQFIASNLTDATGNPLQSGTATLQVVDASAKPMSVRLGGGGQVLTSQASVPVINGAFTANVIDVSLSSPSFPCVQLTVTDNSTGAIVYQKACLQPIGGTYFLDNYSDSTTPINPQAGSTVQGTLGVNGDLTVTGNLSAGGFSPASINALTISSQTISSQSISSQAINGVLNAVRFTGADIGAQVDAAFAALPSTGGTVQIPAGNYTFSNTITFPGNQYHLSCDAGATLTYSGSGAAIALPNVISTAHATNSLGVDGGGGCHLVSAHTKQTGTIGVLVPVSNGTYVTGMWIDGFDHGVDVEGGNTVSIFNNKLDNNNIGVYTSTVSAAVGTAPSGNYSPNAVHMSWNHFTGNGWGFQSHNGQGPITRELGTVIRDNVFEQDLTGDIDLRWDAQTIIEGNYFESNGVAVSAGVLGDNQFDIHVAHNYFTNGAYRSLIEIGNGWDFFIHDNYEEGTGESSGCAVNIVHDPNGGTNNVHAVNAFARTPEGGTVATNELCDGGAGVTGYANGTERVEGNLSVTQNLNVAGILHSETTIPNYSTTANWSAIVGTMGPITFWVANFQPAGGCPTTSATAWFWTGGYSVCQNGTWTAK